MDEAFKLIVAASNVGIGIVLTIMLLKRNHVKEDQTDQQAIDRELRLGQRIDQLEDYIRTTLTELVRESNADRREMSNALREHTQAIIKFFTVERK